MVFEGGESFYQWIVLPNPITKFALSCPLICSLLSSDLSPDMCVCTQLFFSVSLQLSHPYSLLILPFPTLSFPLSLWHTLSQSPSTVLEWRPILPCCCTSHITVLFFWICKWSSWECNQCCRLVYLNEHWSSSTGYSYWHMKHIVHMAHETYHMTHIVHMAHETYYMKHIAHMAHETTWNILPTWHMKHIVHMAHIAHVPSGTMHAWRTYESLYASEHPQDWSHKFFIRTAFFGHGIYPSHTSSKSVDSELLSYFWHFDLFPPQIIYWNWKWNE